MFLKFKIKLYLFQLLDPLLQHQLFLLIVLCHVDDNAYKACLISPADYTATLCTLQMLK